MILVVPKDKQVKIIIDSGKVIYLSVSEAKELVHDMKVRDSIIRVIHKLEQA